MFRQLLLLSGLIVPLGGCAWPVRENTDQVVRDLAERQFDGAPAIKTEAAKSPSAAPPQGGTPAPRSEAQPKSDRTERTERTDQSASARPVRTPLPEPATDVQTAVWLERRALPKVDFRSARLTSASSARLSSPKSVEPSSPKSAKELPSDGPVQRAAWMEQQPGAGTSQPAEAPIGRRGIDLQLPPRLPGSEAPRIIISADPARKAREIEAVYPELPPLPVEPKVHPGPGGKPYTLADFQRLAAANSPTLRQAASDVEAAKGNLIQAMTYPNPLTGYIQDTSATNNTSGIQAGFIDQPIITGGKQKLGSAAAQKDLDNAILALKRARSDLSTAVRNAYFTVLVDVETLIITRAQVQFADEIFRLQVELLTALAIAPYEPTALRAQAYTNRLAYKQAIASYIYDWKALVATLGLPQLPLSEIAGRVDRFIPYFDFDDIRHYMLQHHTDMLTAQNGVRKAQYLLKLAQITPIWPNLNAYLSLEKDFMNPPHGTWQSLALGVPLPIWDQNKGNIIAAQGALIRASKEMHRVEVTLTNSLATAYEGYRNNLYALEYYRRSILPNLVNYYRGVFARRQIDPTAAFGDLVFAQQNLNANVTTYIGLLGTMWSSVVSVADFLQTDDLFQVAQRRELPDLPDLNLLPHWLRVHNARATSLGKADEGLAGLMRASPPDSRGLARSYFGAGIGEIRAKDTSDAALFKAYFAQ